MKKLSFILLSLVLLTTIGCNSVGFKKTKSGLMYKIMTDGKNPVVKRGEWLKIHVRQTAHDSLIGQTYGQMPVYIQSDSFPAMYDPREVLPLLAKGDSAVIVIFGDSIFRKQGGVPPYMKREDKLVLTFKVLDIFHSDSTKIADETVEGSKAQEKMAKESEVKKAAAIKEYEDYLAKNNINYTKTPSGSYVVITDPGSGLKCDTGKVAHVLYKGMFFPSNKMFETNMEAGKQAYPVTVGTASVIKGWDEGLVYFHKGGKGKIYVPFFNGYGPSPGPENQTYANMVFDIEIADVTEPNQMPAPQTLPNPNQK